MYLIEFVCLETKTSVTALAQAVSRRSVTAEARVRSQADPCGICGGQNSTQTGFSRSNAVLPYQYHSNNTPYVHISFIYHWSHIILATGSIFK
jgi:hypothetical protein